MAQSPTARLIAEAGRDLPPVLYAVLDGALFDDVRGSMARVGLRARPLFLEAGDADAVASGPFLVPLDDAGQCERLITLIGNGRPPVIWSWSAGEDSLYRHLRTLNLVDVTDQTGSQRDTLVFRHWDPNVLAVVWPLFASGQRARFLSTSPAVLWLAPERGGRGRTTGGDDGAQASRGLLRFTPEQMAALRASLSSTEAQRRAAYLRRHLPPPWTGVPDAELRQWMAAAEASAAAVKIATAAGLSRWTYLFIMTDGRIAELPEVTDALRRSETPDDGLIALMDAMADMSHPRPGSV